MNETFSFGEWMAQRRKTLDMTQRELAERASCTIATIKKIEGDERRPSRELAELLADTLRIPLEWLETFIECARGVRPMDALANLGAKPQVAAPVPTLPPNLPVQSTPFIGRESELAQIETDLNDPACRLLTLIGPGGIGKTRLAIEAAYRVHERFADGVAFVPLTAVTDGSLIASSIAHSLRLESSGTAQLELLAYLRAKTMLLVLDNCEQLQDGIAWVSELIASAPRVKVLATSRERLQLAEEWVYNVQELADAQAVLLFEQTAQRIARASNLSGSQTVVTTICNKVENLPLAIELAAHWVAFMSPEQIAEHIQRDVDFLAANVRNVPQRHRSMRAVFDHSWELLSPIEQAALMRLSVFRGGWNADEAETVAGATLPLLRALAEKSLVRAGGDDRYDAHELTRQYAADKLRAAGLEAEAQMRHSEAYLALAEHTYSLTIGGGQTAFLFFQKKMPQEMDNFRAALAWMIEAGGAERAARLLNNLFMIWLNPGNWKEAIKWADRILSTYPDLSPRVKARSLRMLGMFLHRTGSFERALSAIREAIPLAEQSGDKETQGHLFQELSFQTTDYDEAVGYLEKALALARELGQKFFIAILLQLLGDRARIHGDLNRAESLYSESIAVLGEIGARARIAYPLGNRGRVAFQRGDYAHARAIFEESVALSREANNPLGIADWLLQLAAVSLIQGDFVQAQAALHENLILCRQLSNLSEIADSLVLSAGLAVSLEQYERAARLLGASEKALAQYHNVLEPMTRTRHDEYSAATRSQLSQTAFDNAYAWGQGLSIDEATSYALEAE